MKNYEINKNTNAIIYINSKTTKIYEMYDNLIVNNNTMNIIEHSCRYFGSSYHGRHEGTKKLIGVSYKSPIIIEESNYIIFIPIKSPRNEKCSWISLKNIKNYRKLNKKTLIEFKNNLRITVDISIGSFENQYLRATKLEYVLRNRINNLDKIHI